MHYGPNKKSFSESNLGVDNISNLASMASDDLLQLILGLKRNVSKGNDGSLHHLSIAQYCTLERQSVKEFSSRGGEAKKGRHSRCILKERRLSYHNRRPDQQPSVALTLRLLLLLLLLCLGQQRSRKLIDRRSHTHYLICPF